MQALLQILTADRASCSASSTLRSMISLSCSLTSGPCLAIAKLNTCHRTLHGPVCPVIPPWAVVMQVGEFRCVQNKVCTTICHKYRWQQSMLVSNVGERFLRAYELPARCGELCICRQVTMLHTARCISHKLCCMHAFCMFWLRVLSKMVRLPWLNI